MKSAFIFSLLLLLLSSCGSSRFDKQKYTSLKKIKSTCVEESEQVQSRLAESKVHDFSYEIQLLTETEESLQLMEESNQQQDIFSETEVFSRKSNKGNRIESVVSHKMTAKKIMTRNARVGLMIVFGVMFLIALSFFLYFGTLSGIFWAIFRALYGIASLVMGCLFAISLISVLAMRKTKDV